MIEQGAIRESKEETGYDVEIIRKLSVTHEYEDHDVMHAFIAKITGGSLRPNPDEIMRADWFTFQDIKSLHEDKQLRAEWTWLMILEAESS